MFLKCTPYHYCSKKNADYQYWGFFDSSQNPNQNLKNKLKRVEHMDKMVKMLITAQENVRKCNSKD